MANSFARMIQTIDSHTEGNSTRVIVGGVPVPPGNTLLERREALWRHDDGLRRTAQFRAARPRHDVLGPAAAAAR